MSCIAHSRPPRFSHHVTPTLSQTTMTGIIKDLPRVAIVVTAFSWSIYCLFLERIHWRVAESCASPSTTPHFKTHALPSLLLFGGRIAIGYLALFIIDKVFIVPIFFDNLGHVPGPLVSRFTALWLMWKGYNNQSNQYVHGLHLRYGPAVRIAPNFVSFNCICSIPSIYGVRSNFPKNQSAASMDNYGKPNTFSSSANDDHRRRRNRYASAYSKSVMTTGAAYAGFLRRTTMVLDEIKRATIDGRSVDIYSLFHFYSIDNASVITLGRSPRLLEGRNREISKDLRDMFKGLSYVFYFGMTKAAMKYFPSSRNYIPGSLLLAIEAHEKVETYNLAQYEIAVKAEAREFKQSVLARLMSHKDYGSGDLTTMHVASEIGDHLLAGLYTPLFFLPLRLTFFLGADTLVASLTYIFWELALPHNFAHLARLITELNLLTFDETGMPTSYKELDALPWLECCLREGLRLHTPSGNIQSRVVPSEGAFIDGDWIPGKVGFHITSFSNMYGN
jgi:hypothetical protein